MDHKLCHGRMFAWNGYGQQYEITSPIYGVIGDIFTPLFGGKMENEYKTQTTIETKVFSLGKKLIYCDIVTLLFELLQKKLKLFFLF